MINFDFQNQCTGCSACADACPRNCITMCIDANGFVMPKIEVTECINCSKCERVCPTLNHNASSYQKQKCYAAYHLDRHIRHIGSSGSVFYAIAANVINEGGSVYAAEMCSDLQVRHTRATDIDGVVKQMKSKYIQSDTLGVYNEVLDDLSQGRYVLFVGTPCQVKALSNSIPLRLRNRLIMVDFVCHGVPSQQLFNDSIKQFEKSKSCQVHSFSFREKTQENLRNYRIEYVSEDKSLTRVVDNPNRFPYYYGFLYHYIQRNSCFNCKHRTINRSSDLTLADFWGAEVLDSRYVDKNKGYSMIVVNSDVGTEILSKLSATCHVVEIPNGIAHAVKFNRAYTEPDPKSLMHTFFFWTYRHFGYSVCEKRFLQIDSMLLDRLWHSVAYRIDKLIHFIF